MLKSFLPFVLASILSISLYSQHTFSIVAVDPLTGEIGSAGATCIAAEDGAIAISDIVLGVGAIHTQSYYLTQNQNNARARMLAGDSPQEIIDYIVANDAQSNPNLRQYGVVDLNNGNPRSAAYTGANCSAEFIHITGPNYSIQGNILISEDVVNDMETGFLNATGTLADKLMAALQGAKRPGADARCLSDGVSSASAFIRVAQPDDTNSTYGNLSLDINVWISNTIFEPIDELQNQYNATLGIQNIETDKTITIYPNPANNEVTIKSASSMMNGYEILDISGKQIIKRSIKTPHNVLIFDVNNYPSGIYFVKIYDNGKVLATQKLIVK
ncbi:DUF1028 domain-containing protein [Aequorivita sp. Q41]|uniref:DUF1028 domain-containing protein n=1 Tax=Aequorivita sp. Q41 TaxID=3153300 RepID=UPI003241E57F